VLPGCPVHIHHFLHGARGGEEWVVNGEYTVTLTRQNGWWRMQKIVLAVQSQEGNTNPLVEGLLPPTGGRPAARDTLPSCEPQAIQQEMLHCGEFDEHYAAGATRHLDRTA
jgi:hypothetical protein